MYLFLASHSTRTYRINLSRGDNGKYGLGIICNMVAFIQQGSAADNDGQIRVGDIICSINGVDFTGEKRENNILNVLKNSGLSLSLVIKRGTIPRMINYSVHQTSYCILIIHLRNTFI